MKRALWAAWWPACLVVIPLLAACNSDTGQAGAPIAVDPHLWVPLTSYCLGDGSGMRVYERQFPMGGTQPLFSIVYTGSLVGNPAYCGGGR